MASITIHQLLERGSATRIQIPRQENIQVAFLYCGNGTEELRTAEGLLRLMLRQLMRGSLNVPESVRLLMTAMVLAPSLIVTVEDTVPSELMITLLTMPGPLLTVVVVEVLMLT